MVSSMTAFARVEESEEWGYAVWEIRTVNHRYLDISLRLPEQLRALEGGVRERIASSLKRGKVECSLRYDAEAALEELAINSRLAARLIAAAHKLPLASPAPVNPIEVLRWPGVIERNTPDLEQTRTRLFKLLDRALQELLDNRRREGEKTARMIEERCELALQQVGKLRTGVPEIINALSARYLARARELDLEAERGRLEQEVALIAQKLDVDEELDRLETHILEVQRVLTESSPIGRRLDFLMQEMNREANTLGSKSAHIDTSNASIELKVLIEQMREQVQNIE